MSNHDREGKGDATLDRAWRQASDERPPARLDAAIIASARKAIQDRDDAAKVIHTGRRSRNWLTGWQPLAAAAGVAGLAFALVQSLPRDRDVAPATSIEQPVSGSIGAPESLSSPSAREAKDEKAAGATAPASAEVRAAVTDSEEMKRAVLPPPPPAASAPRPESAAGALDQGSSAIGSAAMRAAEVDQRQATMPELSSQAASEAAVTTERQRVDVTPPSAEDWAARVEALYASGDVAGSVDALRAFRAVVPDADTYLPDSLRNWAQSVE